MLKGYGDKMDINTIREKIPALKNCIHLNCAAVSPPFSDTITEIKNFLKNRGEKANFDFFEWVEELGECRKKVAELVNASKEEIAFMLNTSFFRHLNPPLRSHIKHQR